MTDVLKTTTRTESLKLENTDGSAAQTCDGEAPTAFTGTLNPDGSEVTFQLAWLNLATEIKGGVGPKCFVVLLDHFPLQPRVNDILCRPRLSRPAESIPRNVEAWSLPSSRRARVTSLFREASLRWTQWHTQLSLLQLQLQLQLQPVWKLLLWWDVWEA